MADRLSPTQRSAHMARIRRANTQPELLLRRLLHRLGYRFRLQLADVPGRPDVAFTARKKAIYVHGCFWHAHEGCSASRIPKTRPAFWAAKFQRNRERDKRLLEAAQSLGWRCLVVWECEIGKDLSLPRRLRTFLGKPRVTPVNR